RSPRSPPADARPPPVLCLRCERCRGRRGPTRRRCDRGRPRGPAATVCLHGGRGGGSLLPLLPPLNARRGNASREISGRPHARWKVGALTVNTGDRGSPWALPTPLKNILWTADLVKCVSLHLTAFRCNSL